MAEENSFTSVGTYIKVSATLPATHNETGFEAIATWSEVGGVDTIGDLVITRDTSSRTPLKTGDEISVPGGARMEPFAIDGAIIRGDAGQELLNTHLRSAAKLSFCVVSPDGGHEYGVGIVTSGGNSPGAGASEFAGVSYEIKPSGLTVIVDPA